MAQTWNGLHEKPLESAVEVKPTRFEYFVEASEALDDVCSLRRNEVDPSLNQAWGSTLDRRSIVLCHILLKGTSGFSYITVDDGLPPLLLEANLTPIAVVTREVVRRDAAFETVETSMLRAKSRKSESRSTLESGSPLR